MTPQQAPATSRRNSPNTKGVIRSRIARRAASDKGLRYISAEMLDIRRVRRGNTFSYVDGRNRRITDKATIARIKSLAIPPAYTDVRICRQPHGHLQAIGIDARGRKQYRYHASWRKVRDADKFVRMITFGSLMTRLRQRLKNDLRLPGLPRKKVVALAVSLLQKTLIRVGNAEYAKQNNSFGLTTLRDRHVQFLSQKRSTLMFRGKGGKAQKVELNDRQLTGVLRRCQELPGQTLFQYIGEDGRRQSIDSGMVNDYLLESMGPAKDGTGFTAKDFRTWGATVLAARLLAEIPDAPTTETAIRGTTAEVCRTVAAELGNTPAICRKSYINPWVFTAWSSNIKPRGNRSLTSIRSQELYTLRVLKLQIQHMKREQKKRRESASPGA